MRCSSFEPLLDRYVEGTLSAPKMRAVRAHVAKCGACTSILDELKIVDALLETATTRELPVNFNFAVMAEVRAMPVPRAQSHRGWAFLALYLAAAWVSAVLWIAATGANVRALFGGVALEAGRLFGALGSVFGSTHGLSHSAPLVAFGVGSLALDIAVAIGVVVIYGFVRPRLAAHLVSVREVR